MRTANDKFSEKDVITTLTTLATRPLPCDFGHRRAGWTRSGSTVVDEISEGRLPTGSSKVETEESLRGVTVGSVGVGRGGGFGITGMTKSAVCIQT